MRHILYLALCTTVFTNCAVTHGDPIKREYTPLKESQCNETHQQMYLFFEGEPLDFDYTRLGHVEAIGDRFAGNEQIIDHLKYQAGDCLMEFVRF